jgi:mannose-1-phosphate guanylyltransferase
MAGGGGTRLWPLSRKKNPKQFHALVGNKSLLQMTYERMKKIPGTTKNDIFISTNSTFGLKVKKQVSVQNSHIILEPAKRDNAAAIGLSLITILSQTKDPTEVVGMFPSDHIMNEERFLEVVPVAGKIAQENRNTLVQLGVRPTYPETGYGYIEMHSDKIYSDPKNHCDAYKVASFHEKPDLKTAKHFVQSFRYLWNTGIFFFRIDTMLGLYQQYLPELYQQLLKIQKDLNTSHAQKTIAKIYPMLFATSLDYGIVEKTKNISVIPVDNLSWSDVGHFQSMWEILEKDTNGNVVQGKKIILHKTNNSVVYGDQKLITCLGVKDLVIVDRGDVLFIANREESQKLKELLALLEKKVYDKLL